MSEIHFHKTNYEMTFVRQTKGEIRSTLLKRGNRDSERARIHVYTHNSVKRKLDILVQPRMALFSNLIKYYATP